MYPFVSFTFNSCWCLKSEVTFEAEFRTEKYPSEWSPRSNNPMTTVSISAPESPIDGFDPRRGLRLQRGARRHRDLRTLPASVRRRPRSQDVDVHRGGVIPQVEKNRRTLHLRRKSN